MTSCTQPCASSVRRVCPPRATCHRWIGDGKCPSTILKSLRMPLILKKQTKHLQQVNGWHDTSTAASQASEAIAVHNVGFKYLYNCLVSATINITRKATKTTELVFYYSKRTSSSNILQCGKYLRPHGGLSSPLFAYTAGRTD